MNTNNYVLPDLKYDPAALEPHISGRIMALHHDKHHAAYVTGANTALDRLHDMRERGDFSTISKLEKDLAFNVSGHVLHSVLWTNLSPEWRWRADRRTGRTDRHHVRWLFGLPPTDDSSGEHHPRLRLGVGLVGARRRTARRSTGLRPPGQPRSRHRAAACARRVGARLLPPVREPEGRLPRSNLERHRLGRRRLPPSRRTRSLTSNDDRQRCLRLNQ